MNLKSNILLLVVVVVVEVAAVVEVVRNILAWLHMVAI